VAHRLERESRRGGFLSVQGTHSAIGYRVMDVHALSHTFATHLARAATPIRTTQAAPTKNLTCVVRK
jgi:site-specific recombinase XerC